MQGPLLISVYLKERKKKKRLKRNIEQEINKIITATQRLKETCEMSLQSHKMWKNFTLNYNMQKNKQEKLTSFRNSFTIR